MYFKKGRWAGVGLLLSLIALLPAAAQQAVTGGILQKVDVKPYAGLPYRVSARIKVDTAQSGGADAWLTCSVVRTRKRQGSPAHLPRKAVSNNWETYTINGQLDK
ncbi:hypothetical protein [Hymenobacter guriensis]|uniref:Uncharacterized protein n=1 Tax=Hymenobacter guriensis TaxID=2793065 RepID=A0ABS0KYQ2_9BACT|nr:hypothetical protein [Hymenobacter guriensis]MBG8553000.1 hypothetical protein [Hymenobacter guriensis]